MSDKSKEWLKQADYDMDTADAMFDNKRYFYAVFMCHLSIEKALKGCIAMGQDAVVKIVKQFGQALESLNIRVEQLILFGSHASGTAREDSDIDVVVISSSFADKSYWERIDILSESIYKTFAPIEASAFTPEEWQAGTSLIADYAQNGVLIS